MISKKLATSRRIELAIQHQGIWDSNFIRRCADTPKITLTMETKSSGILSKARILRSSQQEMKSNSWIWNLWHREVR